MIGTLKNDIFLIQWCNQNFFNEGFNDGNKLRSVTLHIFLKMCFLMPNTIVSLKLSLRLTFEINIEKNEHLFNFIRVLFF